MVQLSQPALVASSGPPNLVRPLQRSSPSMRFQLLTWRVELLCSGGVEFEFQQRVKVSMVRPGLQHCWHGPLASLCVALPPTRCTDDSVVTLPHPTRGHVVRLLVGGWLTLTQPSPARRRPGGRVVHHFQPRSITFLSRFEIHLFLLSVRVTCSAIEKKRSLLWLRQFGTVNALRACS